MIKSRKLKKKVSNNSNKVKRKGTKVRRAKKPKNPKKVTKKNNKYAKGKKSDGKRRMYPVPVPVPNKKPKSAVGTSRLSPTESPKQSSRQSSRQSSFEETPKNREGLIFEERDNITTATSGPDGTPLQSFGIKQAEEEAQKKRDELTKELEVRPSQSGNPERDTQIKDWQTEKWLTKEVMEFFNKKK
jgi:hypothetical protein